MPPPANPQRDKAAKKTQRPRSARESTCANPRRFNISQDASNFASAPRLRGTGEPLAAHPSSSPPTCTNHNAAPPPAQEPETLTSPATSELIHRYRDPFATSLSPRGTPPPRP